MKLPSPVITAWSLLLHHHTSHAPCFLGKPFWWDSIFLNFDHLYNIKLVLGHQNIRLVFMSGKFDMLHKCKINLYLPLCYWLLTQTLLQVKRLTEFCSWFIYFEFKNSLCYSIVGLFQSLLVEHMKICYYAQSTPITGYNIH